MRIPRIYYPDDLKTNTLITLGREASHHLLTVLRLPIGSTVILFNGDGREFLGRLIKNIGKHAQVQIDKSQPCQTESPLYIELAQGMSRGEKMDFVIQKAVELGVNIIAPLLTERCGVKLSGKRLEARLDHWKNIIISACEQSGRSRIPLLKTPMTLKDWLQAPREGLSFVCDPNATKQLRDYSPPPSQVAILIGPEGGLSPAEIKIAKDLGCAELSLGPRTLRTETAAITALSILQSHYGDF